jgi:hypothetical protein
MSVGSKKRADGGSLNKSGKKTLIGRQQVGGAE